MMVNKTVSTDLWYPEISSKLKGNNFNFKSFDYREENPKDLSIVSKKLEIMTIFQNKALNHAKNKTNTNDLKNKSNSSYGILDSNVHNFLSQLNTKLHEYVTNKRLNTIFKKKLNYYCEKIKQKKNKKQTFSKEGNSNSLINKINVKFKNLQEIIKQNTNLSFPKSQISKYTIESLKTNMPKDVKDFTGSLQLGNNSIKDNIINEFANTFIKKELNEKNYKNNYQMSSELKYSKPFFINQMATKKVNFSNYDTFPNSKEFYTTFNIGKNKNTISNFNKLRTKINFCKIKKGTHLIFNTKERRDFHRENMISLKDNITKNSRINEDPIFIQNFNYQHMQQSPEYNIMHKESLPSRFIDESRYELLSKLKKYK